MNNFKVKCGNIEISNNGKFCLIAGPCQLETEQHAIDMSSKIKEITSKLGIDFCDDLKMACKYHGEKLGACENYELNCLK